MLDLFERFQSSLIPYGALLTIPVLLFFIAKARLLRIMIHASGTGIGAGTLGDIGSIVFLHAALSAVSPHAAGYAVILLIATLGAGNEITFRRFARPVLATDALLVKAGLTFSGWGDFRLILRWAVLAAVLIVCHNTLSAFLKIVPNPTFYAAVAGGALFLLLALGIGRRRTVMASGQETDNALRDFLADGMLAFFAQSVVQAIRSSLSKRATLNPAPVVSPPPAGVSATASVSVSVSATAPADMPDIVVIVLESFFDIERSPLFDRRSLMPALRQLTAGVREWSAVPPVIGGKTANTEFEILSGIPLACVSGVDIPFRDLKLDSEEALPRSLKQLGYGTTAVHPGTRQFWNRHVAYPALGFDRYLALDDFQGARRVGAYVDTEEVVAKVEGVLSAGKGPQFVYAVSILGHGPYDTDVAPRFPVDLPNGLNDEVRRYCHLLTHADAALDRLATFVKNRRRPTLALVLGDHAPSFNGSISLSELGFDCQRGNLASVSQSSAYIVPLIQISNVPLPAPEHVCLPTYLIGGYLFAQLGLTAQSRTGVLADQFRGCQHIDPFSDPKLASLASPKEYQRLFSDALARQIQTQELISAFDAATASPGDTDRLGALVEQFDAYFAKFGEDALMLYRKGVLECLAGRFIDAERNLNRAIQIGGVDQFWSRYWRGRAYIARAAFYHARRDFEECAQVLEMSIIEMARIQDNRLLKTVRQRAELENYLGIVRRETAKLYQAIARKAAEEGEETACSFALSRMEAELPGPAAFIRGIRHTRRKEWAQARSCFTTAIEYAPGDFWSYFQRANCNVRLGNIPYTLHDLDCADRINPGARGVLEMRKALRPAESVLPAEDALS